MNSLCFCLFIGEIITHQCTESIDHCGFWCISFCEYIMRKQQGHFCYSIQMVRFVLSCCYSLQRPTNEYKNFDLVAVYPKTEKLFHVSEIAISFSLGQFVLVIFFTFLMTTNSCCMLLKCLYVFPHLSQAACMTFDVDIICIAVTEKQPFHFKRAPVNGVSL